MVEIKGLLPAILLAMPATAYSQASPPPSVQPQIERSSDGHDQPALVPSRDFGKLKPFYIFICQAREQTPQGQVSLYRTFAPDGSPIDVHAGWDSPITYPNTQPHVSAVWNSENGKRFDLDGGWLFISWELVPRPKEPGMRGHISVAGLRNVDTASKSPLSGVLVSMGGNASLTLAHARWRDFLNAAQGGGVTVRLDVSAAPAGWKAHLYPGYLNGIETVGAFRLQRMIPSSALNNVDHLLRSMAAQTDVPRPSDVPRRCLKMDSRQTED